MDPSKEYLKYMTKSSVERNGAESIHNPAPKLGTGARFRALESNLAAKGAQSPGALAAWIGRRKYGKQRFQRLAAAGRRRK